MKLIVGLGNPGEKYKLTRHNIGFIILDEYVNRNNLGKYKEKFKSEIIETSINNEKVIFMKPITFMNLSGEAIQEAVDFYKLDITEDVLVIYDDKDMDMSKIKIRLKGSSGGHNGIKSIIKYFGEVFPRLKYGVGKPEGQLSTVSHVLGKFTEEEKEKIRETLSKTENIINGFIKNENLDTLMNKYNG